VGQLISLTERIAQREGQREHERQWAALGPATFFFTLDCPLSYLLAERVERDLGEIAWAPVLATRDRRCRRERLERARAVAIARRLPLVEPENYPSDARPVSRAARFASEQNGCGGAFALSALRLAFAGGFDLADPEFIAEAAAAAGISVDGALKASADASLDHALGLTASGLRSCGIIEAPVIRVAGGWLSGVDALGSVSVSVAARHS
jgi:2-hydroxychromene-2-carboxylate isomerase